MGKWLEKDNEKTILRTTERIKADEGNIKPERLKEVEKEKERFK
jgi:hypothetical protein